MLVNKVDLVTEDKVAAVEALIRDVNPTAQLIRTTQAQVRCPASCRVYAPIGARAPALTNSLVRAQVPAQRLLDIQAFSEAKVGASTAQQRYGNKPPRAVRTCITCLQMRHEAFGDGGADTTRTEANAGHSHTPGVSAVSLCAVRDVDLAAFKAWMHDVVTTHWRDLFRVKGILAVAGSPLQMVAQGTHADFCAEFGPMWPAGEPRQSRLVFIGRKLDRASLERGLHACLLPVGDDMPNGRGSESKLSVGLSTADAGAHAANGQLVERADSQLSDSGSDDSDAPVDPPVTLRQRQSRGRATTHDRDELA